MDDKIKLSLMREAIAEANKSKAEDGRNHPLVGAIVTDDDGKILLRAHRGEDGGGGHAEYSIFRKAASSKVDLNGKTLFVTLEPCTRRGPGKIPCAVRVSNMGIRRVFIGTIDPNPNICGRGELHLLSRGLEVERFPFSLTQELMASNKAFFDDYAHYSSPVVAVDDLTRQEGSWKLPGNREAILQASLELMISSEGPIEIFSGGSSWVRELQIGLLYASLAGRSVKILCEQKDEGQVKFAMRRSAALASGATVAITGCPLGVRGTMVSPGTPAATLISIERSPTLHGLKLSSPHEKGVLGALTTLFNQQWSSAKQYGVTTPQILPISLERASEILKKGVPAYRQSSFRIEDVPLTRLRLLSRNIERFKLFRMGVLEEIIAKYKLPRMGYMVGSPWPYIMPIVEVDRDGKYTVIDGAHRVYHALQRQRIDSMEVIVVDGVDQELPAKPIENLDDIKVTSDKWKRLERYIDFAPANFRDIKSAFEADLWEG